MLFRSRGNCRLGSLGRGEPARLWGIGLVATAIAAAVYIVFAAVSARFAGASRATNVATSAPPDPAAGKYSPPLRAALLAGSLVLPFLLWWLILLALDVPTLIAKSPAGEIGRAHV